MKKLLLINSLFMMTTLLQADAYLLIMSKDDKLCQNINSMFNKDLFEHKEVRLENHKEFNAVVWDKEFEFYWVGKDKPDDKPRCDNNQQFGCKNAIFDINNDGKDELVAFMEERLYGIPSYNEIDFAPQEIKNPLNFKAAKSTSVGFKGSNSHNYKELPVQDTDDDDFKFYISSSSHVLLRPLKIENIFYIATFFNTHGRDNWDGLGYRSQDLNDNNMVSISKYDVANEQHDICYLMRVFTSPTFQKTTKKDN